MFDILKNIAIALILAGVCAIGAYILKNRKQQILAIVTNLIQEAENTVQGSGLGTEKKAKVIAQLEAMGITVNDWLDKEIDAIVKYLNDKSGWFVDEASSDAKDVISEIAADATEKI